MVADFNKKQKRGFSKRNLFFVFGGILFLIASVFLILADIKIYREKQKLTAQLEGYKKQIEEIENRNKEYNLLIFQEKMIFRAQYKTRPPDSVIALSVFRNDLFLSSTGEIIALLFLAG
ncbi:MAG: hypothetical protein AABZ71_00335 [Candidatus Binatota bacterium]